MRAIFLLLLAPFAVLAAATTADAKSCSTFAIVQSYDAAKKSITIDVAKGDSNKFFPKPEGSPNVSKVPGKCNARVLKSAGFEVRAQGGKLSITQVRRNFSDKMLNNPDDPNWLPAKLDELIKAKTMVVLVLRPDDTSKDKKNPPHWVSTVYMPIEKDELDEIARLEAQAEDVD
ncbi:MAG TPA: hypothetical protein VJP77_01780 [Planctomycetota bacterium]|nr:hypothetical protein [Planctomycetota bacterium]